MSAPWLSIIAPFWHDAHKASPNSAVLSPKSGSGNDSDELSNVRYFILKSLSVLIVLVYKEKCTVLVSALLPRQLAKDSSSVLEARKA